MANPLMRYLLGSRLCCGLFRLFFKNILIEKFINVIKGGAGWAYGDETQLHPPHSDWSLPSKHRAKSKSLKKSATYFVSKMRTLY